MFQLWLLGLPPDDRRIGMLPNGTQVATILIGAIAAVFGYFQWADARREASLEKFYERLRLTNDRYDGWPHARALVGHFWDADGGDAGFQRRMYAFLELDNLEYMILRYELGFVRERLIWRAIRTFASRCESLPFRRLVVPLAAGSGYDHRTKQVVECLAAMADVRHRTPPRAGEHDRPPSTTPRR